MNINKVYVCDVYQLMDRINNLESNDICEGELNVSCLDCFLHIKHKVIFRKKAIVYYSDLHKSFIDLETKEKYKNSVWCSIGDLFVDVKRKMIPVSSIIDYKNKNMSKRRILEKYDDIKRKEFYNEY